MSAYCSCSPASTHPRKELSTLKSGSVTFPFHELADRGHWREQGEGHWCQSIDDMGRRLPGHTACSCPLSFPCLTPDVQHIMTYYTELPDLSNLTQIPMGSFRCMATGCSVTSVYSVSTRLQGSPSDVVLQKEYNSSLQRAWPQF